MTEGGVRVESETPGANRDVPTPPPNPVVAGWVDGAAGPMLDVREIAAT